MKSIDQETNILLNDYDEENVTKAKGKEKKTQIILQTSLLLVISILLVLLICEAEKWHLIKRQAEEEFAIVLPQPMVGLCNATCIPNKAYPCIYSSFYPVSFTKDGTWRWDCPFIEGPGTEIGVGKIIGLPQIFSNYDQSWNATWYGGNKIISDPYKRIHCACYYVGGKGVGNSWLFQSFQIKIVKNGRNDSIEKACGNFTGCPKTIEDALEQLDAKPYIEKYFGCK